MNKKVIIEVIGEEDSISISLRSKNVYPYEILGLLNHAIELIKKNGI